jgi:hypothetical protein
MDTPDSLDLRIQHTTLNIILGTSNSHIQARTHPGKENKKHSLVSLQFLLFTRPNAQKHHACMKHYKEPPLFA